VDSLKLHGLDGSHLFGFLAAYGLLRLLHQASLRHPCFRPRLYFDKRDYCASLDGVSSVGSLEKVVRRELRAFRKRLINDFASVSRPADLTQELVDRIGESDDDCTLDELAGLGCNIGGEAHESTLCAANGAGHQNLVLSMRDVLALLERHTHLLLPAISHPWALEFEPTAEDRLELSLGNRKPTLRLDPSDERLYALRLDNPVSSDASYRTELGAQALAAAAFGGLPVVPRQRHPVTVGSERRGTRTFFYWGLWSVPASYTTVRSFLATGVRNPVDPRARGFFAAFRAARVTGAKGKLSFAPTEPWW
jgi:hypothetical protein